MALQEALVMTQDMVEDRQSALAALGMVFVAACFLKTHCHWACVQSCYSQPSVQTMFILCKISCRQEMIPVINLHMASLGCWS